MWRLRRPPMIPFHGIGERPKPQEEETDEPPLMEKVLEVSEWSKKDGDYVGNQYVLV